MPKLKEIRVATNILKKFIAFGVLIIIIVEKITGNTNPTQVKVIPLILMFGIKYKTAVASKRINSVFFDIPSFFQMLSPTLKDVNIIRIPSKIIEKVIKIPSWG